MKTQDIPKFIEDLTKGGYTFTVETPEPARSVAGIAWKYTTVKVQARYRHEACVYVTFTETTRDRTRNSVSVFCITSAGKIQHGLRNVWYWVRCTCAPNPTSAIEQYLKEGVKPA